MFITRMYTYRNVAGSIDESGELRHMRVHFIKQLYLKVDMSDSTLQRTCLADDGSLAPSTSYWTLASDMRYRRYLLALVSVD